MKDQIQKIALLFLPIFLSSCFTYRSMESDEPVEPMENSPPLPAEVKIKADVHTNYNSALTSTVILILTYGFWPSVGSAESRIDYIATDQGGYSRRVATYQLNRTSVISWCVLPAMVMIPFTSSFEIYSDPGRRDGRAHQEAEAQMETVRNSKQAYQFLKEARNIRAEEKQRLSNLLSGGAKWSQLREFSLHSRYPAVAAEAAAVLAREWQAWLYHEIDTKFKMNPTADVYWPTGVRWGPVSAMFRNALIYEGGSPGMHFEVKGANDCLAVNSVEATHCYQLRFKQKDLQLLLRRDGEDYYLCGFAENGILLQEHWERAANELLDAFKLYPKDWNRATNPALLNWTIAQPSG